MGEARVRLALNRNGKRRPISLLANAAAVAATAIFICAGAVPNAGLIATALADSAARPVGFAAIVAKVKPAVISVRVKIDAGPLTLNDGISPFSDESPLERFLRRFALPDDAPRGSQAPGGRNVVTGQGSGFFISADGYAVTNGHVVDKAKTLDITTDSGKSCTAKVIGIDSRSDIALIKVEGDAFPFVKFSEASPRVGDGVIAVGNPFGLGGTATAGIVSAHGRDIGAGPYDDLIQIDALAKSRQFRRSHP
jgi:serine protease Do